jgi:hypothetical protein
MAPTGGSSGEVATESALAIEKDPPAAARTLARLPWDVEAARASRRVAGLCLSVEVAHATKGRYRYQRRTDLT